MDVKDKDKNGALSQWLRQARIGERRLSAEQRGLLWHAFAFRQRCGDDYYSSRLLSHFLLHCDCGLKVAQIARLVGFSRPTASHQQGLSSKEAIQAAHHRMAGRAHGKMLPRFAGPIAEFMLSHADATRFDVLDFIKRTFGVHVSTVALHHFCRKYGLDRAARAEATARPSAERTPAEPRSEPRSEPRRDDTAPLIPPVSPVPPVPPAPPFSRRGRNTRGRSC